jgi:hypothetical protein
MKRIMKYVLFLLLLSALPKAKAQTINAASCSQTDVQAAFSSVTMSTTTVNIPAGTCTWTSPASLTLPSSGNLTIQGASSIAGTCGPGGSCTATDSTVIVDNYSSTNSLIVLTTNSGCTETRFTGITFKGGTGSVKQNGMLAINGNCHSFRLDHNHFLLSTSTVAHIGVRFTGWVYGVMDHNLCDMTTVSTSECENVWTDTYGGDSLGDGGWADNSALGTANFMYVENNTNNNGLYFNDCDFGGRAVVRYNVLNNSQLQTHPTGSTPNADRGCRAQEVYQNQFNGLSSCNGGAGFNNCLYNTYFLSSGTGVYWGNTVPVINSSAGSGYQWGLSIQSMRISNSTYTQNATPTGWGYCGTALNGTGSNWDENTSSSTGYACLDQPGRGKGDLLANDFPNTINTTTGTIAWPHEALEPIYEWLDSLTPVPSNPGGILTNSNAIALSANRDYYLYTGNFTGTSGTGSGLLSARPTTCTPLVAYWATDTNTLYQCATKNTWTLYYTPYTYPHPLTVGGVTAPAGPNGLQGLAK